MKTLLLLMFLVLLPLGSYGMHLPAEEQLYSEVAVTDNLPGDNLEELEIQLWPNPAQDFLQIDINNEKAVEFHIINAIGVVMQQDYMTSGNRIDISNLSPGMYFLKVSFEDKMTTQSFLKR